MDQFQQAEAILNDLEQEQETAYWLDFLFRLTIAARGSKDNTVFLSGVNEINHRVLNRVRSIETDAEIDSVVDIFELIRRHSKQSDELNSAVRWSLEKSIP